VEHCRFEGPADGESALKEARNICAADCSFSLRYPLWHVEGFKLENCSMDEKARAAIWYAADGTIESSCLGGIKALRECRNITMKNTRVISQEFGWKCRDIHLQDTEVTAEYLFLDSRDVTLDRVQMKGKYSFQYIENCTFENCNFDTKDAFWHARNITVRNSTVKGEYLAWYCENVTFENCTIIGTQPLCYCKGLKLINCAMIDTDLSFEKSEVDATLTAPIISIKTPLIGTIRVPSVGEIIFDDPNANGVILQNT
jgi:hypothetical protein